MAYGRRLYAEFYDDFDVLWRIDINEDGYAGADAEMSLGGDPLYIRKAGTGDLFQIIHGTQCIVNILADIGDDYSFLFTADARKYQIKVYRATILYWAGFVLPGQSITQYSDLPSMSIEATDGLGYLDQQTYLDTSTGYPYEDYETLIGIIATCLQRTGLELPICSMVNLLPDSEFPAADTDDALELTELQRNRFQDLFLNPVSCLTVLREILRPLGARIFQGWGGAGGSGATWFIERTVEVFDTSVAVRDFDYQGTRTGYRSLDTKFEMTATTGSPRLTALSDSNTESYVGYKSVKTIQDFGLRPSLLMGYNFPPNEFEAATPMRHFTIEASSNWDKLAVGDGYVMRCSSGVNPDSYFESNAIAVSNSATVESKLTLLCGCNAAIGRDVSVLIFINEPGVGYYYWDGTAWQAQLGAPDRGDAITMKFPGVDGFDSPEEVIEDSILGFPANGNLYIRFYDKDAHVFISEILYIPKIGGVDLIYSLETNTSLIDEDNTELPEPIQMLFNDTVGYDNNDVFSDGIFRDSSGDPTSEWQHRSEGATSYRLRRWLAQGYIDNKAIEIFNGTIAGRFELYGALTIPDLSNRRFVPDDVQINIRSSEISGRFIEVVQPSYVISLTETYGAPVDVSRIQTQTNDTSYTPVSSGGGGGGTTDHNSTTNKQGGDATLDEFYHITEAMFDYLSNLLLYRVGTDSVVASVQKFVNFSNPFISTYTLRVWCRTSEGYGVGSTVSGANSSGFAIDADVDCTVYYEAVSPTTADTMRAGNDSVTGGVSKSVIFATAFADSDYTLKVWCETTEGYSVAFELSSEVASGFDIDTDDDCTVNYIAVRNDSDNNMRAGTDSATATVPLSVTFPTVFLAAGEYVLDVWCLTSEGYSIACTVSNESSTGFDVLTDYDCTVYYIAIKKI